MSMHALRTFLLISVLTGIFLGIGFLLGGFLGITIGLIIALVINFIAYWYSDKIVLKMYGAKPLKDKKINDMIQRLAKKAGLPMPKTYLVDMPVPNAFATGRNENHAAIAVTSKLMELLDDDEIEGVLAHEISHIKNRDILINSIAATIGAAISWAAYVFMFSADEERGNVLGMILLFILAPLAATLIRLAISRNREYFADYSGAQMINPLKLASALNKISKSGKVKPRGGSNATAHMFIMNPFSGGSLVNIFSTHPQTEDRIARLKEIARQKNE